MKKITEPAVKLENLRSALSGLSQDSGIGSSQEMPSSLPSSDEIVIREEHLDTATLDDVLPSSSSLASSASMISGKSTDEQAKTTVSVSSTDMNFSKRNRKRYISESSLSDFDIKRPKIDQRKTLSQVSDFDSEISASSYSSSQPNKGKTPMNKDVSLDTARSSTDSVGKSTVPPSQNQKENSELCIICNNAPKDSIFLHTNIAHQCCCYKCAKRTLYTIKRCPICNRSVNKVVKIYTS